MGIRKGGAIVRPNARLTWPGVLAWRLKRKHLDRRAPRDEALGVVREICGLHAQVMSSAELTLWARVENLEPEAVREALWERRSLAKTWAMRGTLDLLPSDELPTWVASQGVLKPRYHAASWQRYFGLTREEAEAMLAAIAEALDGRMLTREELAQEVGRLLGSEELGGKLRDRFGALLKPSAFKGDLLFAPSVGRNVRFAQPDWWLPGWDPADRSGSPGGREALPGRLRARHARGVRAMDRHDLARAGSEAHRGPG